MLLHGDYPESWRMSAYDIEEVYAALTLIEGGGTSAPPADSPES